MRLRIQFSKGEAIRYISHLDLARVFERAIRRAKIPVAMSEGFNPHIKVAYASALSVGVTSDCEYIDIELREEKPAEELVAALRQQMPAGLTLLKYRAIQETPAALMAVVNMADYQIEAQLLNSVQDAQLEEVLRQFYQAESVTFVRRSPKGNRTIDVRPLIDTIKLTACCDGHVTFFLRILITDKGTVKPQEVMKVLAECFAMPINGENAIIHRHGLYVYRNEEVISPLEVIR